MAREYFHAYHSYLKSIEPLNDAERGRLFTACLEYSMTGVVPDLRGNERFLFPTMQEQIDRDRKNYEEKCEMNRRNGSKGGEANATKRVRTLPNAPQTPPKEKEKEKEKTKENIKESEKETFGEFGNVLLTKEEYQKLTTYCKGAQEAYIARLDGYIQQNAKNRSKYTDHYAVVQNWYRKDHAEEMKKDGSGAKPARDWKLNADYLV